MNTELQKLHDFIKLAGFFSTLGTGLKRRRGLKQKLDVLDNRSEWMAEEAFAKGAPGDVTGLPKILSDYRPEAQKQLNKVKDQKRQIRNTLADKSSLWSIFRNAIKKADVPGVPNIQLGAVGSAALAPARGAASLVKRVASHDEVVAIDKMIKNREMLAEQFRRLPANSTAAKALKNQIEALDNNIFTSRQQLGGITDRLTFGSRANAPRSAEEAWQYGGLGNRAERAISGGRRPGATANAQPAPQPAPNPTQPPKQTMWEQYQGAFNKNPWLVGGLTAGGVMTANNVLRSGSGGGGGNRTVIL